MQFLLDTNFLMIPYQFRVDIYSELTEFGKPSFYTLDLVIGELEKITKRPGKNAKYAKLALLQLKQEGVRVLLAGSKKTDTEMVRIAKEKNLAVCTQDKGLIKRLRSKKIPVITLRQKRYLIRK